MTVQSWRKMVIKGIPVAVPADTTAETMLSKIAKDDIFLMKSHRARNPQHHRKFFALLSKVHENLPDEIRHLYPTTDKLLLGLKIVLGYTETMIMPNGKIVEIPKSIAFESMDQTSFEIFWDRCLKVISEQLLPGIDDAELEAEIAAEIR